MHTSPVLSQTVQDYSSVGLDTSADSIRGISQCKADLALSFAVSGVVAKTTVEEGDTVKKGDVLIELECLDRVGSGYRSYRGPKA
jgi:multidrug efflux pump subunit AcrA (membrane-fusion protein)